MVSELLTSFIASFCGAGDHQYIRRCALQVMFWLCNKRILAINEYSFMAYATNGIPDARGVPYRPDKAGPLMAQPYANLRALFSHK